MRHHIGFELERDFRCSQWTDCRALLEVLDRVLDAPLPEKVWSGPAVSFLDRVGAALGVPVEAVVAKLLAERVMCDGVVLGSAFIDPSDFPARGGLAHPGTLGEYFLPLCIHDGVLTCVSHTPFLLPSLEGLRKLAGEYGVEKVGVVSCLPINFEIYHSFVVRREVSEMPSCEVCVSNQERLLEAFARIDLEGYSAPVELSGLVGSGFQRKFDVVPVGHIKGSWLTLAAESFPDLLTRSEIGGLLPSGYSVGYVLADTESIQKLISASSTFDVNVQDLASRLHKQGGGEVRREAVERIDFRAIHQGAVTDDGAPAVMVLQTLLLHGVRNNASDLHIARSEKSLQVEYRLDDWKRPYPEMIPVAFSEPILARIKVLAELDLQRHTEPQLGRFLIDVAHVGEVEVRVTIMPTIYGESATLRFARRHDRFPTLGELGLLEHEAKILQRVVDGSYGLGLVVGPTGSGKSTTLYSLLAGIPSDRYEVLSCEDPVERFLPGVKQTNVNKGLSYAAYLAGALRADPDYIHVGETRTRETAEQVLKAAETGHVVLTTLHTHQACSAPARLFGLGIEPYVLADTLSGVVAQQLLPKLCPHCEEAVEIPDEKILRSLGVNPDWFGTSPTVREGTGCSQCRGRGALGRMVVAEGFYADSSIHRLIIKRSPLAEFREAQVSQGGRTLLEQAIHAAGGGKVPLSVALSLGSAAFS